MFLQSTCYVYSGNGTGLLHYPFSLSIILCKPDIRLANWTACPIRRTRIRKNLNYFLAKYYVHLLN